MEYCHLLLILILNGLCILSRHGYCFVQLLKTWSWRASIVLLKLSCSVILMDQAPSFMLISNISYLEWAVFWAFRGNFMFLLCMCYLSMGTVPGSKSWIGKFIQWSYRSSRCCNIRTVDFVRLQVLIGQSWRCPFFIVIFFSFSTPAFLLILYFTGFSMNFQRVVSNQCFCLAEQNHRQSQLP